MKVTKFTELFDNTPSARVLNVMICGRGYDYALTDLSRTTGLNRQRLAGILKRLTEQNIIYLPRKMSGMQMYKIDATCPVSSRIIELYDKVMM